MGDKVKKYGVVYESIMDGKTRSRRAVDNRYAHWGLGDQAPFSCPSIEGRALDNPLG